MLAQAFALNGPVYLRLGRNKEPTLTQQARPAVLGEPRVLREGQEVEVELEFSLTYSPRDAVGYVDGYMVIVEGGRQYLGERRKVRVTSTSRAGATATVLKKGSN